MTSLSNGRLFQFQSFIAKTEENSLITKKNKEEKLQNVQ